MTEQNLIDRLAEIVGLHVREIADLLRVRFTQSGLTRRVSSATWRNEGGLIVGSVSIWSGENPAEDSIDGLLTIALTDEDVKMQVDVCRSTGALLCELFEHEGQFGTQGELIEIINASVQVVLPKLVSTMMSIAQCAREG